MVVHVRTQTQMEFVKWLVLLAIAGALALLLVGSAMGIEAARPPGLLPPDVPASPLPLPPAKQPDVMPPDLFAQASDVWKAIELHKSGNIDEAIAAWEALRLPRETNHWRLLMLAVAHMQHDDAAQAAEVLEQAQGMAPENPVIHYTLGLMWLGKAHRAEEWYDASGMDPFRLASTRPQEPVANTRSMCRLAAMMAFQRAVELASHANLDQALIPEEWLVPDANTLSMPVMTPRVRDVLQVFGGERFEGRSHLALGLLHMQQGDLKHAEQHLDGAARLDEPTGSAFRELSKRFEDEGLPNDAMRAQLKAFSHGAGAASLEDAIKNFGEIFFSN